MIWTLKDRQDIPGLRRREWLCRPREQCEQKYSSKTEGGQGPWHCPYSDVAKVQNVERSSHSDDTGAGFVILNTCKTRPPDSQPGK